MNKKVNYSQRKRAKHDSHAVLNSKEKTDCFQNPESSAMFNLLQISEENSKLNNKFMISSPTSFQAKSYSTEFIRKKPMVQYGNPFENSENQFPKNISEAQFSQSRPYFRQSVAKKSTCSNDMRKTVSTNLHQTDRFRISKGLYEGESPSKIQMQGKKVDLSSLPLTFLGKKQTKKVSEIFHSNPSKSILTCLKRVRDVRSSKNQRKQKFSPKNQVDRDLLSFGAKRSPKKALVGMKNLAIEKKHSDSIEKILQNWKQTRNSYLVCKRLNKKSPQTRKYSNQICAN